MKAMDFLCWTLLVICVGTMLVPMTLMIGNSFYSEYKIYMVHQEIKIEKKKQELAEIKKGEQE